MMKEYITLQVRNIDYDLHRKFRIKCLHNCQGQKEALTELLELYISEPKLKKNDSK